jgi:hypothetical protein
VIRMDRPGLGGKKQIRTSTLIEMSTQQEKTFLFLLLRRARALEPDMSRLNV